MTERKFQRREFLKVSGLGLLGAVAAACAQTPTATEAPPAVEVPTQTPVVIVEEKTVEKEVIVTVEVPAGFNEAPALKAKVDAGELPPVDERLPEAPLVVGGRDAIGVYGGEVRMIINGMEWFESAYDLNSERFLHYSDIDWRTIVPNVLEGWEFSADGKEWTFKMRKGMKWSDGVPITSEDVRFWWEDFCLGLDQEAWGWGVPWQMRFGGENAIVEYPDDFSFKFTFAAPFGNFGAHMTRWGQNINGLFPSHFCKQYLPKYADQASIDALVAAEGKEDLETGHFRLDQLANRLLVWTSWHREISGVLRLAYL